jgi:anti-anti-sigma regulatory factor
VFRIRREAEGEVILTLIGRMSAEDLPELDSAIALERSTFRLVLDLRDLTLVDREVVHQLANFEKHKIRLKNCPGYIRLWIDDERQRKSKRKK